MATGIGIDCVKGALIFGFLAFQLHVLTMAVTSNDWHTDNDKFDKTAKAFLAIAYLLFAADFVLLLIVNFTKEGGNRIIVIVTAVLPFVAAALVIIAVSLYNIYYTVAFPTTTYVIGALSGVFAGILLLLPFIMKT